MPNCGCTGLHDGFGKAPVALRSAVASSSISFNDEGDRPLQQTANAGPAFWIIVEVIQLAAETTRTALVLLRHIEVLEVLEGMMKQHLEWE